MDAATTWKAFGTKVTGFDLVDIPIHYWDSHSWEVDEVSLDNITWVQGNLYAVLSFAFLMAFLFTKFLQFEI